MDKNKKIKVAIPAAPFSWGGGAELIKIVAQALSVQDETPVEIYLLWGTGGYRNFIKNCVFFAIRVLKAGKGEKVVKEAPLTKEQILDFLKGLPVLDGEYREDIFHKNLEKKMAEINAKALIMVPVTLGSKFKFPWVGYIPDFQHKHLPQYFSSLEIAVRNRRFEDLMSDSDAMIVNSRNCACDIDETYPSFSSKVVSLPFTPVIDEKWLRLDTKKIAGKYKLPKKYFIVSNQFWVHKSHLTAFEALSKLSDNNIHLVCTGNMFDYRVPGYVDKLKQKIGKLGMTDRIHLLGHIPKEDQIAIMRESIAVVQPTLFEGGPGGGSVYNAVALGVPAIVSDIAVNKELEGSNLFFFKSNSSADLADKMSYILKEKISRPGNKQLLKMSEVRLVLMKNEIIRSIELAKRAHKGKLV